MKFASKSFIRTATEQLNVQLVNDVFFSKLQKTELKDPYGDCNATVGAKEYIKSYCELYRDTLPILGKCSCYMPYMVMNGKTYVDNILPHAQHIY